MFKILVVEDDQELNKTVCVYLNQFGYEATGCLNASEAYDAMYGGAPFDLIISDIMFAQSVRELNKEIPILFMTARDDFASKQRSFKAGIDDYMVKPVDDEEMLLRISALLRRSNIANEHKLHAGNTVLDYDALTVTCGGVTHELPNKEFMLLFKLLSYQNKIFTRRQLMDELWDMETETDERTIDVHINRLRERFRDNEDFEIVTVRGLGYKAVLKQH